MLYYIDKFDCILLFRYWGCSQGLSHKPYIGKNTIVILWYVHIQFNLLIAEKHFVQIERAKEVLLDKEMRKKYDEWRRGGFKRVISFQRWLDIQPQVHQVHNNVVIVIQYTCTSWNSFDKC